MVPGTAAKVARHGAALWQQRPPCSAPRRPSMCFHLRTGFVGRLAADSLLRQSRHDPDCNQSRASVQALAGSSRRHDAGSSISRARGATGGKGARHVRTCAASAAHRAGGARGSGLSHASADAEGCAPESSKSFTVMLPGMPANVPAAAADTAHCLSPTPEFKFCVQAGEMLHMAPLLQASRRTPTRCALQLSCD